MDKALGEIEVERQLRRRAEINASETKLQYQQVNDELQNMTNKYKNLLAQYNQQIKNPSGGQFQSLLISNSEKVNSVSNMNYALDKLLNITEVIDQILNLCKYILKYFFIKQNNGGCRVVAFSNRYSAILVSQPSNNAIFPGFGIKKVFEFAFI